MIKCTKQEARERFEWRFGEIDIQDAIGVDNEKIDAELMAEYSAAQKEK